MRDLSAEVVTVAYSLNRIAFYRDRCIPPLTQAALARALGVHNNTVQNWEKQGAPNPADLLRLAALFVERGAIGDAKAAAQFWDISGRERFPVPPELAQLFTPTTPQLAQMLPTEPPAHAPLPSGSHMALQRNRLFTGRAEELRRLAAALDPPDATTVISGLAGMGKSQLASEFVHRYGQCFSGGVFWISFADVNAVAAGVAACGGEDHLSLRPDFDSLPLDRQLRLVLAAWREPTPRLLVFDNCEDEALLAEWRPPTGGCRVLVTSRRSRWSAALISQLLALQVFERAESIALLRGHCRNLPGGTGYFTGAQADLDAIADELGDLPLALHLAGAYLAYRYQDLSPAQYLEQLRAADVHADRLAAALQHPSLQGGVFSPTRHDQHLARAFALSYQRLRPTNPIGALALKLLVRAANLAPGEPIPRALLFATVASPNDDALALAEEALILLVGDLGLLELDVGGALRMHRLVAAFARMVSTDPGASADVTRAIYEHANHLIDYGTTGQMRAILGHMRFVMHEQLARVKPVDSDADSLTRGNLARAAGICSALGMLLVRLADYEEALPYLQQAVALSHQGGDAATTVESLVRLAILQQYRQEHDHALRCYAEALTVANAALPADDPLLASCATHLGYALSLRGAFEQAAPLLEQGLAIAERVYGPHHSETADYLSLLGYHLVLAGDYATARPYLERAVAIRERELGPGRPLTVQSLNNLGELLHAAGELREARVYHERALAGRIELFGEHHHGVAESYRNLGMLALAEGDAVTAQRLIKQALTICEGTVGPAHRDTALAHQALAEVSLALGRHQQALDHFQQALAVLEGFYLPGTAPLLRLRACRRACQCDRAWAKRV
jgi:tetratricopeptide (TPR) repeat protein/DNA-binding XRE family transcriptional regulator